MPANMDFGTQSTYDSLTYNDTNMEIFGTPLDINTGIFTVPVSGAWRVTFSMGSVVWRDQGNMVYLYLNDDQVLESQHDTYSDDSGVVWSTSGRELTREVS